MIARGIVVTRGCIGGAKTYDGHDLGLNELGQRDKLEEESEVELQRSKTTSISIRCLQLVRTA